MLRRLGIATSLPLISSRTPLTYMERGQLSVKDSAVTWWSKSTQQANGQPITIPILQYACILLGPGTSITHEAIKAIGDARTALAWVGQDGWKFYAAGRSPETVRDTAVKQAYLSSVQRRRETVARRMFRYRFGTAVAGKSIEQLRGMEGIRVRDGYASLAVEFGIPWEGRNYDMGDWQATNRLNQLLCQANAALYSIVHAVLLAMGYLPDLGFIHTGTARALTFDIADLYKLETSFRAAFQCEAVFVLGQDANIYQTLGQFMEQKRTLERMCADIPALIA